MAPFHEFPWPTRPETADHWAAEGGCDSENTDFGCDRWVIDYPSSGSPARWANPGK